MRLTPEQLAVRAEIGRRRDALTAARDALVDVASTCPCVVQEKTTPDYSRTEDKGTEDECTYEDWGSARCAVCDGTFEEFYCPKSPDHLCHYQADDPEAEAPVLTLLDETTIPYPRPHGSYDEFCVYCGEPDERK